MKTPQSTGSVEIWPTQLSGLVGPVAEYQEPTNEQLANFLVIYAKHLPAFQHIMNDEPLSPAILEMAFERQPGFREVGLRHHKKFQEDMNEYTQGIREGTIQCEHIRPNSKRCPNRNEPGRMYCGLHTVIYEE